MKKTRFLSILLAVMITLSSFSCLSVVSFAAVVEGGQYDEEYNLVAKEWSFNDANGLFTVYMDVTDKSWLMYKDDIVKVIFTENVSAIDDFMFSGFPNLTEVVFDVVIGKIGKGAFQDCDKLTDVGVVKARTIADYAFFDCDSLVNVEIYSELTSVGKNIFKSCDSLETATIVNGVTTIGEGMFEDCIALKDVVLPDSVETIGRLAFENCSSITSIVIPDSTKTVGEYAFYDCAAVATAYIGHNVEGVGEYAFGKCAALESVEIKCAMPIISEGMFYGCSSLKGLSNLPEGIKTIGKNAFKDCSSFSEITLPTTVIEIGDSAFDATAITSIDIPVGVETIGSGAFTNCNKLSDINVAAKNRFYASVDGVLYNADVSELILCPAGKKGELTVWDSTTEIADDAFIGCVNVTKVTIPRSVTEIADNAFNGCSEGLVIACDCDSVAAKFAKTRRFETEINHVGNQVWQITAEATCLEGGSKELVCSACDYSYEKEPIEALGHNYDNGVVTTKATCETDGVMTYTCTRAGCGDTYAEVISATDHNMDDGTVKKAATCEEEGTIVYKCKNEGCNKSTTDVIPALNHKYDNGVVVVEPACGVEGVKKFTCQNAGCNDSYTEAIPALNHKYDSGVVVVEPACGVEGVKKFTCQNAGCNDSYTEAIPALNHNYDSGVVVVEPACGIEGVKKFTCQNAGCNDSYTETIPALTHDYSSTVIKNGNCITHTIIEYTCNNCGDTYSEKEYGEHIPYSYVVRIEPTCEKEGKEGIMCSLCREFIGETTVIPKTEHTAGNWIVDTKATCTAKGSKHQECTECGKVLKTAEIAATGHTESSWITDKKATVNSAGKKHKECTKCDAVISTAKITQLKCAKPKLEKIATTKDGVKITWNKVAGADKYNVYRKTKGGEWKLINSTTKTAYTDKTAKSGTKYYYAVKAVNEAGNSSLSSSLSKYYLADPTLKSATSTKNGVALKWNKVAGAEGYIVYRKTGSGSYKKLKTVDGVSYTDKTAKKGKKYTYKVKAFYSKTSSDYSNVKTLTDKY